MPIAATEKYVQTNSNDIQQDYYQQNFPNDGQRFVAWYLRNVHLRDPIQAHDDITDGADDKQIDAIFVDDDKSQIIVIQGKFLSSKSVDAEPLREVISAWMQLRDLVRLQEVGRVPNPEASLLAAEAAQMVDDIIKIAGTSLNMALEAAANAPQPSNRVFSPQNWIKTKTCLAEINFAIRNYFAMLPLMPGGREQKARLDAALSLDAENFEYRWAAD